MSGPRGCAASALVSFVALACGERSNDDVPPALLAAIREGSAGASGGYPAGPYGSDTGAIAADTCIRAWSDPVAADFDPAALAVTCFADFYDPEATENAALLVNTSALWCGACRSEYGGSSGRSSLPAEVRLRSDRGLRVLGALFQDAERAPATEADAALWARTFGVDFPFGLDAPFALGAFADPVLQPFNMLIDTRTMRIVLRVDGDNPETLWPAVDDLLE